MHNLKKKGVWDTTLMSFLIAILVLVLTVIAYVILSGKAEGALDFIRRLMRFGR